MAAYNAISSGQRLWDLGATNISANVIIGKGTIVENPVGNHASGKMKPSRNPEKNNKTQVGVKIIFSHAVRMEGKSGAAIGEGEVRM